MKILCRVRNTKKEDVLSVYIPTLGGVSYGIFSINIMDHTNFRRLLAPYDLLMTNSLWLNAHVGVGLYMYTRKHMTTVPVYKKILFSSFGTVAFNFGSVLIWASVKSLLPENTSLRVLVGVASSVAFLYLGKEYLDHVDRIATDVDTEEKETIAEDK